MNNYSPTCLWRWNTQSVPKRRHIKFRRRGITQKKTYNIQNTAKVWNQECFGWHTAHRQELKNCNCSLWFYISFWSPAGRCDGSAIAVAGRQPKMYVKPETAIIVFVLLMMGGVSAETYWAIKKNWNNTFYCTVASCWFFLWDLYYDARIHEHQI